MSAGRRAVATALVALLAGCGDSASGPPPPTPGPLTVTLAKPMAGDAAMLITISGPAPLGTVSAAAPGLTVYSHADGSRARVAVFGAIVAGPLVRVEVPDTRQADGYSASIVEVAEPSNALREDLTGYSIVIRK